MKSVKLNSLGLVAALFALTVLAIPRVVVAETYDSKVDHNRQVDAQIADLELKIKEVKANQKINGVITDQKIKEYENQIADVKRNREKVGVEDRVSSLRKDFHEWRLNQSIRSYEDKIGDLKMKARNEVNEAQKVELEQKIDKLQAKYNAAQSKLNDLRLTNGDNWDKIQNDLDNSLLEIERDYKQL